MFCTRRAKESLKSKVTADSKARKRVSNVVTWGLQDLLKEHDVPAIPGVTTPMTYIGMWKVQGPPCCRVTCVSSCSHDIY